MSSKEVALGIDPTTAASTSITMNSGTPGIAVIAVNARPTPKQGVCDFQSTILIDASIANEFMNLPETIPERATSYSLDAIKKFIKRKNMRAVKVPSMKRFNQTITWEENPHTLRDRSSSVAFIVLTMKSVVGLGLLNGPTEKIQASWNPNALVIFCPPNIVEKISPRKQVRQKVQMRPSAMVPA